jgi:hypothetical protein
MANVNKCAHPSCKCMTTDKYCSAFCEGQAETPDIECACGHEPCADKATKTLA